MKPPMSWNGSRCTDLNLFWKEVPKIGLEQTLESGNERFQAHSD
jgi:hypothetical protein